MAADTAIQIPPRLAPWPKDIPWIVRAWTFAVAWCELLWLDILGLIGFRVMRRFIAETPISPTARSYDVLGLVRFAVRDACIFYFKDVHCLQRSSAVARMLRRRGLPATLVIGYLPLPVMSHAWVELDGNIVWDHIHQHEHYRVIDRV
jgi:Transglutaminase-like superfamily